MNGFRNRGPINTYVKVIIASVATFLIAALGFYITLPAINIHSQDFWGYLTVLTVIWGAAYILLSLVGGATVITKKSAKKYFSLGGIKWIAIVAVIPVAVLIVGNIISSTLFNADKYSSIIEVPEAVFEEDMPENDTVTNIALMDSASATIIGNRTLGALSDVVSQFQVGEHYSQINYGGAPAKVANLEYVDFFKWLNNKDTGIPGYVKVDPVNSGAEYVKFSKPMKYVDSAYFGEDLMRKLIYVSEAEGRTPNNQFVFMLRNNIQYFERAKGKFDAKKLASIDLSEYEPQDE